MSPCEKPTRAAKPSSRFFIFVRTFYRNKPFFGTKQLFCGMYPCINLATTFLPLCDFVVSDSRSTLPGLLNTAVYSTRLREIQSTLFPSRLRRTTSLTLASVQALALRKQEEKGLDVLAKQPVASAERPVRAVDESRARTERWGNKARLRSKIRQQEVLVQFAISFLSCEGCIRGIPRMGIRARTARPTG